MPSDKYFKTVTLISFSGQSFLNIKFLINGFGDKLNITNEYCYSNNIGKLFPQLNQVKNIINIDLESSDNFNINIINENDDDIINNNSINIIDTNIKNYLLNCFNGIKSSDIELSNLNQSIKSIGNLILINPNNCYIDFAFEFANKNPNESYSIFFEKDSLYIMKSQAYSTKKGPLKLNSSGGGSDKSYKGSTGSDQCAIEKAALEFGFSENFIDGNIKGSAAGGSISLGQSIVKIPKGFLKSYLILIQYFETSYNQRTSSRIEFRCGQKFFNQFLNQNNYQLINQQLKLINDYICNLLIRILNNFNINQNHYLKRREVKLTYSKIESEEYKLYYNNYGSSKVNQFILTDEISECTSKIELINYLKPFYPIIIYKPIKLLKYSSINSKTITTKTSSIFKLFHFDFITFLFS
ncbi:hypothetical protein ACTFIR_007518 [Dictyostelium discoideum]